MKVIPFSRRWAFAGSLLTILCLAVVGLSGCAEKTAQYDSKILPKSLDQRLADIDNNPNLSPEEKAKVRQDAIDRDRAIRAQSAQYQAAGMKPQAGGKPPEAK